MSAHQSALIDHLILDVAERKDGWSAIVRGSDLKALAAALTAETGIAGEVALALENDAFVQTLNKTHRGLDKPTNVLSFPAFDPDILQATLKDAARGVDQVEPVHLGDVALALETIEREASEQGKTPRDHALHLMAHGILHLIGYDHEDDEAADSMEQCECAVLARLGIADPYA